MTRCMIWLLLLWLGCPAAVGAPFRTAENGPMVCDAQAGPLERLAAREIRRYVYARTGKILPLSTASGSAAKGAEIVVANRSRSLVSALAIEPSLREQLAELSAEQYLLKTVDRSDTSQVLVVGGEGVGTLYAAYRLAEYLGVRFYLHGDVVPDERVRWDVPRLDEVGKPLYNRRGILPFHDFPEGPDWWDANDYKAVLTQLPKLRMNFFGLHTYPAGRVGPEPTVWIGTPDEIGTQGRVTASYPSRHFVTRNVTAAWGYQPQTTSSYAFGAAAMFSRDNFGADYMQGTYPWTEMDQEAANGLFNRVGRVLDESFTFARTLGVKTCVGSETPLVVPEPVGERLRREGRSPENPETIELLYEGMFRRIMAAYPIDYYWLWTPEPWTWREVEPEQLEATLADFQRLRRAARKVAAPFQLATCGWVLGPPASPTLFDRALPKSWPLSCINRNVGHDPVEPGFARISDRPQWAIPWLEDDPALILPQLWVGRLRKDAADALRYGCDGLLGIHWRTRVLGPNVAALAHAGWSQKGWKTAAVNQDPPPLAGTVGDRRVDYPAWRSAPCEDFYLDWAKSQFGQRAGERVAPIFAQLDCRLPRPSTWVNGPGGLVPDSRAWRAVRSQYDFVEELRDLRPLVIGAGNQERFDYWLNQFRYLHSVARLCCTWSELNTAVEGMKQAEGLSERKRLAERKVIPWRIRLVRELADAQEELLQTVNTKGAMGTVANWQQHVIPLLLDPSEQAIVDATGQPLPNLAQLPRAYAGKPRMFVPVVRTLLERKESLRVQAIVLGMRPLLARLYWRPLGSSRFESLPLRHVARGVHAVELKGEQIDGDFEYYIQMTDNDHSLRFPVTAPGLNQTVVIMPSKEPKE